MALSERFEEAFRFAHHLHSKQVRKGSQVPYISHLMAVTSLVLEHGGDEDQAIAALLHDAIEDQGHKYEGGVETLKAEIRERFGSRVLEIVEGCTDGEGNEKPPWKERKNNYLAHIAKAPDHIRLVSMADKLHNARSILIDLRTYGESVWSRFTAGKEGSLWYYRQLVKAFRTAGDHPLVDELIRVVQEMERVSGTREPVGVVRP